jgi:hypothetical protein
MTSLFTQNILDNKERQRQEELEAMRATSKAIRGLDTDGVIKALNNVAKAINNLADAHRGPPPEG